jgi:hypothetical protein
LDEGSIVKKKSGEKKAYQKPELIEYENINEVTAGRPSGPA